MPCHPDRVRQKAYAAQDGLTFKGIFHRWDCDLKAIASQYLSHEDRNVRLMAIALQSRYDYTMK